MVSCVPRERARFAMTSSLLQKCLVVVTNDLLDQVNALFIHCHMCIQVYFTALCARCLSVEHCALRLLCRRTYPQLAKLPTLTIYILLNRPS